MSSFYIIHSSKELWNRGQRSGCPRGLLVTPSVVAAALGCLATRRVAHARTYNMHAFRHTHTHTHTHTYTHTHWRLSLPFPPRTDLVCAQDGNSPEQHWTGLYLKSRHSNSSFPLFYVIVNCKSSGFGQLIKQTSNLEMSSLGKLDFLSFNCFVKYYSLNQGCPNSFPWRAKTGT